MTKRSVVYLVGHAFDTEVGKKTAEWYANHLGHKHLTFIETNNVDRIDFEKVLSVWLFEYSSVIHDKVHKIIAECRGYNVPLERLRGGAQINQSRIWRALEDGTDQEIRA